MEDLSPKFERAKGPRKRPKVQRGPLPPWESPGISLRPDVPKIDWKNRPAPLEKGIEDYDNPIIQKLFGNWKKSENETEEEDDPNSKDLFAPEPKKESTVVKASSSGAPIFKESDSNSDLESPGPSKTSTQKMRAVKKRGSLSSNTSTMSSVVYPDVDASKLGYSDTTTSFGSPARGHSTVLMPKPVLGIPKFNGKRPGYPLQLLTRINYRVGRTRICFK